MGRNVLHLGRHLEMFLESSSVLRDPEVYQLRLFARWKHFRVAVEEVTVCVYH